MGKKKKVPFISIFNEEIENARKINEYEECPECKKLHKVEKNMMLYLIKCCGSSFLVGINGKRVFPK